MTEEELCKKIQNEEKVYIIDLYRNIIECKLNKLYKIENNYLLNMKCNPYNYYYLSDIFSTKEKAKIRLHWLENHFIVRTEQLPFITWKEFIGGKEIEFFDSKGNLFTLDKTFSNITLWVLKYQEEYFDYPGDCVRAVKCTEENFYKMYELCKQYFNGKLIKKEKKDEI